MNRRAFTLLEVIIALAILSVGLMVLADSQATALMMTTETDRIMVATSLAEEKMAEVHLMVEQEGFREGDIEEEGDFEDFGAEEFRGETVDAEFDEDTLSAYKWAYTVRQVDIALPDLGGAAEQLVGSGYFGDEGEEEKTQNFDASQAPDLGDFITPEMITEMLGAYIREVRVLVWWGDNEDEADQVELLTHVINPSGTVIPGAYGTVPGEESGE